MRQVGPVLASLWWTTLLLVGLPVGLVRFAGWPLPDHVPTRAEWVGWLARPLSRSTLVDVFVLAIWVMWAALLATVAWSGYLQVARLCRRLPTLRLPRPVQALSATMLGTVAAGTTVVAASPPAAAHAPVATATDMADRGAGGQPSLPDRAQPTPTTTDVARAGGPARTVTVARGDTLWGLAGSWLGRHDRWPQIYHLNAARYDQHGRMHGGAHIEPGWVLALPAAAPPPAGTVPAVRPAPATSQASGQATSPSAAVNPGATPSVSTPPGAPAAGVTATSTPVAVSGRPDTSMRPKSNGATRRGVSLPGGGWVDLELAAAITAAAALVWARRRRRYAPREPTARLRLDDPDLAPLPPVIAQLRRGLRRRADPEIPAGLEHPDGWVDRDDALGADADASHDQDPYPDGLPDDDLEGEVDAAGDDAPDQGTVDGFGGGGDGSGEDGGHPVPEGGRDPAPAVSLQHLLSGWPPAGLGLTGPGAPAAARGFLITALAADSLDEPDARPTVVIPAATLATLLGAEAVQVGDNPRLTVTADLGEALDLLEAATLYRTRLVDEHEVDTVTGLRDAAPLEEPLPPILLVADADANVATGQRARIASLLTQGQRLDIHGVLLGEWADGNTVDVAVDGSTGRDDQTDSFAGPHGAHPADPGRLAVIDPTQTADLLRTLAQAHPGAPQPAAPVEAALPTGPAAEATCHGSASVTDVTGIDVEAPDSHGSAGWTVNDKAVEDKRATRAWPDRAGDLITAPTGAPGSEHDDQPHAATAEPQSTVRGAVDGAGSGAGEPVEPSVPREQAESAEAGGAAEPLRARVHLLGLPRVENLPPPSRTDPMLRPQAVELLVYLVAHGGKAKRDDILYDVLGDAPQSKAAGRLNTFVYSLRRSLKTSAGGRPGVYVGPPDQDYALGRDLIDLDLWRMQAAIAAAQAESQPPARLAALREAVACYTGPLAEGRTYEWIEPYREAVRRQAVDAHTALADALASVDPGEAAAVLEAAIGHDPYNDALYQQAMRLHARLGDSDAIRRLRKTLTRRLGEIDAEPAPDTMALSDQLLTDLARRPRQPRPVRGDAA